MIPLTTRPAHVPPEQWDRAQRDLQTYRRELLRLLQEGHAGRYGIIKDDQIISIWDTLGDALQAAGERFGPDPVATYHINPLDVERFALIDAQRSRVSRARTGRHVGTRAQLVQTKATCTLPGL